MKTLLISLTFAGAMLVSSAANAAAIGVAVGPVRVGIRTAPVHRTYVAPRPVHPVVVRPVTIRPVPAYRVVRPVVVIR